MEVVIIGLVIALFALGVPGFIFKYWRG
jgi:hypothetical protein